MTWTLWAQIMILMLWAGLLIRFVLESIHKFGFVVTHVDKPAGQ